MKTFNLFTFLLLSVISTSSFAQSPKKIEAEFSKLFDKLNYWDEHRDLDTTGYDSLDKANEAISKRLEYYRMEDAQVMNLVFKNLGGASSDDGLVRMISWDNRTGGTQHVFENVIQYKTGQTIKTADAVINKDNYVFNLDSIFTLKIANKTYYLITYYGVFGLYERGEGVEIFDIENGKWNAAKLIKTKSGLTSKWYYTYNQHLTNSDIMSEITMDYSAKDKTITFPVILEDGRETDNNITYKFNGRYFEKAKN